jgi:hypothetical protein
MLDSFKEHNEIQYKSFFAQSLNHTEHIPKMKTNYMGFDRAC